MNANCRVNNIRSATRHPRFYDQGKGEMVSSKSDYEIVITSGLVCTVTMSNTFKII